MNVGIGNFLWKVSVALYLLANGALGLFAKNRFAQAFGQGSDFANIFHNLGFRGDTLNAFVVIASIIAFAAGILVILEMLNIQVPMRDVLIFIIAIIWGAFVVVGVISWVTDGFDNFWPVLQRLAVHTMIFSSLLIASKKFG